MIQAQAINYIIKNSDCYLISNNNLTEEFFSDYTEEYRFIVNHIQQYGKVPDPVTFLGKFPDFDVLEVNETESYIIDELYKDKNQRFLAKSFNKIRELLNNGKVEQAMNYFMLNSDAAVKSKHLETFDPIQDISRYESYLEKCEDFSKFYVKTGFTELDELIGGWDRNEELATIVARPGIGKSWVLLKCATAALNQGLRVGIYSGEMSETKVAYRLDTLVSHISNTSITKGNRDVQNEYKRYLESLKDKYKEGCIKILTPNMLNGAATVNSLRAFIEKENLDILFVDQHSLLEDQRNGRSPVEKASNISRDLKNLQVMKKLPVIAVSQQNRESTDNGVTTANVAQSDRISQDSTIVIFLEQKDNILTLILSKSRDSEANKKINYAIDLNKGVFNYIPESSNALAGKGADELYEEYEENVFCS